MGQLRSRDAGQEAAAEAGRVAKSPSEPLGALSQNFRLRIWGSEVRILPGAPIPSSTYGRAPFESRKLKRFFKRFWPNECCGARLRTASHHSVSGCQGSCVSLRVGL